jgi:2-polyprenyl-6-methoxyphenol hydroxylase-like FAD-dependent oxidoreductase
MNDIEKTTEKLNCRCCIVGGGPAGMMLGFLLARAGIEVAVLEKHADFLRDFRGDTIHPSTLEIMHELGLIDAFLKLPHQEVSQLTGQFGDNEVTIADFTHLSTYCKFVVLMPQWDFLNFLAEQAQHYPNFHLCLQAEVTDIIQQQGRVLGVSAKTPRGALEVRAELTIAADGRGSILRERAGLEILDLGAPMDVLWMRMTKQAGDPQQTMGRVDTGKILAMLDRGDYWQCAYVIRKGRIDEIRAAGLSALREDIASLAPFLHDRVAELKQWDDIKLLTVRVDRLRHWHSPGLLCIGDAAHAMSPIGGVGINLAIQDAVATGNILVEPLLTHGEISEATLHAVQRRRELPTRLIQGIQLFIQNRGISNVLAANSNKRMSLPLPFRVIRRFKWLRRIPARIVGLGFRPEHVKDIFRAP